MGNAERKAKSARRKTGGVEIMTHQALEHHISKYGRNGPRALKATLRGQQDNIPITALVTYFPP